MSSIKVPTMTQLQKLNPANVEATFNHIESQLQNAIAHVEATRDTQPSSSLRNLKARMKRLQARRNEYYGNGTTYYVG